MKVTSKHGIEPSVIQRKVDDLYGSKELSWNDTYVWKEQMK